MNRLKKKTQLELAGVAVLCIIGTAAFVFLTKINAQGLGTLMIGVPAGVIALFLGGLSEFKFYRKLDERERDIYIKAMIFSMFVFVGFWMIFTFGAFFVIGGKGAMPVGILPLMLFLSMLVAQASETGFITIYFLREDDESMEGCIV